MNRYHHNIFDGHTNSPVHLPGYGSGIAVNLAVYRADLVCHDNKVDNNLFVNLDEAGILLKANGFPAKVRNNSIRNNIFYNTGSRGVNYGRRGVAIAMERVVEEYGNIFQNNCILNPGLPAANAIYYYGMSMDVAAFDSSSGTNSNVMRGNLQADPLFVGHAAKDFHLGPMSPCVDKGVMVGLAWDYEGNPIPAGGGPDIGVYENR